MTEQSVEDQLFAAAEAGDTATLNALLEAEPDRLHATKPPYEHTLLHVAAFKGQLAAVSMLLDRGIHPNVLEIGDRTYPMHWAAAAGHLQVVERLADAGGDVIGRGDDHGLEVIGWATFWEGCDDQAHRDIADFLISRGAQHHIFSAIALGLAGEVRRIVAGNAGALTQRLTRNDGEMTALHFAVSRRKAGIVQLLLELGADPLVRDGGGEFVATYASEQGADLPVMSAIRQATLGELDSARRGNREANVAAIDIIAALALSDWPLAEQLASVKPALVNSSALQVMAKRGATEQARWLIDHGADVNLRHAHWDTDLTPLHLAVWHDHPPMVQQLLDAGADVTIKDSKHDGNALDWADHFERPEMRRIIEAHTRR